MKIGKRRGSDNEAGLSLQGGSVDQKEKWPSRGGWGVIRNSCFLKFIGFLNVSLRASQVVEVQRVVIFSLIFFLTFV